MFLDVKNLAVTYLGTASLLLEIGELRLLTDPTLDPPGTHYDFGPWYAPRVWAESTKVEPVPRSAEALGEVDAVLLSHDHHADNLDFAGRAYVHSPLVRRVVTTPAGAGRLARPFAPGPDGTTSPGSGLGIGAKLTALPWLSSTTVTRGGTTARITATPARHGPIGTPRVHEVCGFLIETDEASILVSGDTVAFPALDALPGWLERHATRRGRLDLAVVHAGAVSFPRMPIFGRSLFTFDAEGALAFVKKLDAAIVLPVHYDGWTHFRQPAPETRARFDAEEPRARWLDQGCRTAL